jgi:ubiquinone/menaquinone biosynthesis C-methylase UbiE
MLNYNELAEDYAQHRRVQPDVLKALLTEGHIERHSSILEVGCGTGNYIITLHSLTGCIAHGIDPSEQMLAQANARTSSVSFSLAHAEALGQPESYFDLVFSVDVIHHIRDRRRYFAEARRVLKPGGRLCTVTDSETIIRQRQPLSTYWPETVAHELRRYPAIDVLHEEMRQADFVNLTESTVEFRCMLTDCGPFEAKAYSTLHLIPPEAFERGLTRMQRDLQHGPIASVSRYVLVWGEMA